MEAEPKPEIDDVGVAKQLISANFELIRNHNQIVEVYEDFIGQGGHKVEALLQGLPVFPIGSDHIYAVELFYGDQIFTSNDDGLTYSVTIEADDNQFVGHEFRRVDNRLFLLNHETGMAYSGTFNFAKVLHLPEENRTRPFYGYEIQALIQRGQHG